MRTRIKFCGCMSAGEAQLAVNIGVDAVGVIFASASPRYVSMHVAQTIAQVVPAFVSLTAVFVDPAAVEVAAARAAGYVPQFSGSEAPELCETADGAPYIKVFHVPAAPAGPVDPADFERSAQGYRHATWMFDTGVVGQAGGTGRSFDWTAVRAIADGRRIIVSGGLNAHNVGACIRQLRPFGVDVRSGIETAGNKDESKMRAFVRAVKDADAQA